MPVPVPDSSAAARHDAPLRRIGIALASVALLAFAGLSLWYGGRAAWSDAGALQARWLVNEWRDGSGPVFSPKLWLDARDDLVAALQSAPDNAQLLNDLGFLYAARAQGLGTPAAGSADLALQQSLLTEAIASYRAAATLRPTFPYSWAYLALAKHLRGERDAEFWLAFDKALHYGHSEAGVKPALAQVAFANWPALSAERQSRVTKLVATAPETQRKQLLELAAQSSVTLPGL